MSTPRLRLSILPLIAAAGLVAGAEPAAGEPILTNRTAHRIRLDVEDLAVVAMARFYVSEDGGKTWTLAEQLEVPKGTVEPPRFQFTAKHDGSYGFKTSVVYLDNHRDPEPQPGDQPQIAVVIDATPPEISAFTATLESFFAGRATVKVAWAVADAHLGDQPVQIEFSGDGGSTYAPLQRVGATGAVSIVVAAPAAAKQLLLRLTVVDLAGNSTLAPAQTIDLPAPPAPTPTVAATPAGEDRDLAQALKDLPALKEAPAPAAAVPPPAKVPEVEVVRGGPDVEQAYWDKLAAARGGPLGPKRGRDQAPATVTFDNDQAKAPPAAAAPQGPVVFVKGADAAAMLADARVATQNNDLANARNLYQRLRDSDRALEALPEELTLLYKNGQLEEGLALIDSLPPERLTDLVLVSRGRLLIALKRYQESISALATVPRASTEAPHAMYLIGTSFVAMGKFSEARRILAFVARGDGKYAMQAKAELDQLPASP